MGSRPVRRFAMKFRKPTPGGTVLAGVVLVLSLALVPAAFAGKGRPSGGGGSSSITGPVMVTDVDGDGVVSFGDIVTFNESTTATSQPYVNVLCYQNGVLVMNSWAGFFDQALNSSRDFGLYSPSWQSGAADCIAWVDMNTKQGMKQLASVSFQVGA
jgi:hypothetical protein